MLIACELSAVAVSNSQGGSAKNADGDEDGECGMSTVCVVIVVHFVICEFMNAVVIDHSAPPCAQHQQLVAVLISVT